MTTRAELHRRQSLRAVRLLDQVPRPVLAVAGLHLLYAMLIVPAGSLGYDAKVSLFAFLSAMTLWAGTRLPAGYVALTLVLFIILMKAGEPELLYQSMAEPVVWLMIGAFVIGEAFTRSGLADRMTHAALRRFGKKGSLVNALTGLLFATSFFIPSTSGRAALARPVLNRLGSRFSARERQVLSVLAPAVILMSTSATLLGAGSHLIGIGLLETAAGQSISFVRWLIWGVPFAAAATWITVLAIRLTMWPKAETKTIVREEDPEAAPIPETMSPPEKRTLVLISLMLIGWMTDGLHGYGIAFVTMAGAAVAMVPRYGILTFKEGIRSVSWNLILFVAAATALGTALIDTGVVKVAEEKLSGLLLAAGQAPEWLLVLALAAVTVTSHLYITSHTTRAVVLVPTLILTARSIGADPAAAVFLGLVGMNYCLTMPVSSKALLLFYEEGDHSFSAKDLAKLSSLLAPAYIALMVLFYFTYWKWTGLGL
ncbi:Citrate/succinate antiporter [Bhargavaea cecembensis DSE10]|uniref:Citrate/succinate antiporter n=1 Tax=Bhargavaea cecembensis DSE10 TaxID=1235279 RepID=M7NE29_9BACL|nr:SLC13 family permease [Bhargavaea cecembensis]EMR05446.1 Citrate/succinate antiporter [Bhargavaea cecembensis DSE10]